MIYLDNSATTRIREEVLEAMLPYLQEEYGNPSSKYYSLAENAKRAVHTAREQVAALVGCDSDEVVFTSGATESNNMILKGAADYYGWSKGLSPRIVTTKSEHPSILETCAYLESKGCAVHYEDVDSYARTAIEPLRASITRERPLLVSVMWGNNETGSLNPIEEIAEECHQQDILFHTDATQIIGKIYVDLQKHPGIRFLSLSAHKLNGPKGIGAAIIRKEAPAIYTKLTPLLHGGGQENDYRSGTLAVHNIVGFGKAAELAAAELQGNAKRLKLLETYLVDILRSKFDDKISFNNDHENKIPGILSVQFKGINNELLIKKLSAYTALSTGSACSSSKPSHVLGAAGKPIEEIRQTVRFSLSPSTTEEELDFFKQLS